MYSFQKIDTLILQTYPAARIAGRGFKWTTDEPGSQNIPQGTCSVIVSQGDNRQILITQSISIRYIFSLIQFLAINHFGCVLTGVEHLLMVECSSVTKPGNSPSQPVATIKSQAMSSFNLREVLLQQSMLQNMSGTNSLLKRTVTTHMSQTQSFSDHILPLFQPLQAMDAQALILEIL